MMSVLADVTPPGSGSGLACKQAQHVARYTVERHTLRQLPVDIGDHLLNNVLS